VIGTDNDFTSALLKALKGSSLQLSDLWKFKGSIFIEGDTAQTYSEAWANLGFEIVTEDDMSFNEWIHTDNKAAYINFTDETNSSSAKKAVLERLHVFTRKETSHAYLQAAALLKNSRKEVLI
jgi:carbamoyl-phosphate synthase large subunit